MFWHDSGSAPPRWHVMFRRAHSLIASTSAFSLRRPPTSEATLLTFKTRVTASPLPVKVATLAIILRRRRLPWIFPRMKYTSVSVTLMPRAAKASTTSLADIFRLAFKSWRISTDLLIPSFFFLAILTTPSNVGDGLELLIGQRGSVSTRSD